MPSLLNGVYKIHDQAGLLSSPGRDPGSSVVVFPGDDYPGQSWRVQTQDDGTFTIQEVDSGLYLSGRGQLPMPGTPLTAEPDSYAWLLVPGQDDSHFYLVPGRAPMSMTADVDLARAFPPRLSLLPLRYGDTTQQWYFEPAK